MRDKHSSVILALLAVTLIAIPQASQTVTQDINSTGLNDLEAAANSSKIPVSITSSRDTDSYNQTVTSSKEQTTVRKTHNRSITVHETPEFEIKIIKEPGLEKRIVESEKGRLTDKKGFEEDFVKVEGPEGTLVERTVDGEIKTEFEGVNLQSLKDRRESLQELMRNNIDRVSTESSKNSNMLNVDVQPDTSMGDGEYVRLENLDDSPIDLEGWRVEDDTGTSYTFTNGTIEADESIKLYTDNPDAQFNWDRGLPVWAMSGDKATVYNRDNEIVGEHSYD